MAADSIPVAPLSIWDPVHLGTDELGRRVEVTLAERNMLIGGEPGGGKSVALQLIVAHGALSPDCRLILVDGKRVELGLWRACADRFIGPSIDDAIDTLHWLQGQIDERTEWLLDHQMRKITPALGWPVYLMPIDEVAYFSATVGTSAQQKEFNACNRDIVARGRAPGIIPVEATQRPSRGHHPHFAAGPVRVPVGVPLLHRSLLGHDPGPRLGQRRVLGHRDRPASPRRVLAAGRGRHPPPGQSRLPHRSADHRPGRLGSPSPRHPRHPAGPRPRADGKVVRLRRDGDAA